MYVCGKIAHIFEYICKETVFKLHMVMVVAALLRQLDFHKQNEGRIERERDEQNFVICQL